MTSLESISARVSMIIHAAAGDIISAFVVPETLTQFWLSSCSAPLDVGATVHWEFMVPGAEIDATATRLQPGRAVSWKWSDGSTVEIDVEEADGACAVTIVHAGFQGSLEANVASALNSTEGFTLVLADLKTLLESGASAHLVRDKARLIAAKS